MAKSEISLSIEQSEKIGVIDHQLSNFVRLRKLSIRSEKDTSYMINSNYNAFDAYYELTRHMGPHGELIIDKEAMEIANNMLESKGFKQVVDHERLALIDHRIFSDKK